MSQHKLLIKIVISLAIMALLAMRMDLGALGEHIGDIQGPVWLVAALMIFVQIIALAYRWFLLINAHEHRITYHNAMRVTLASMIANYLFITSIGGIIVRVAMSVQSGISLVRSIAATALDRVMTLLALLILTALFLPVLSAIASHDMFSHAIFILGLFSCGAFLFALLMFETFRRKIIFSHRKVTMCFKYLRTVMTDHNIMGKIVISSLIGQVAYFAAVYAVTASMGIEFSWLHFISILPLITIIASLPVGYGGWGIREGAFVYGLGLIDIPIEVAFAASVQIGLISMICAFIVGIPALVLRRNSAFKLPGFIRQNR
ncbi:MAG: flippase-like domain-containing protein [Rhodospirillales bacterium]|nr:flippase-like domain-containing protein [Rhodospirillales bacterium]